MSDSSEGSLPPKARTPIHLWVVGLVALLWNAIGALDYVMTATRDDEWLLGMNVEQLNYLTELPSWVIGCWATAVWGSVLGSGLLLAKNRRAVPVFLVALLCMIAVRVHMFALTDGLELWGEPHFLIMNGVIFTVGVCLYFYSRAMRERGVFS